MFRFHSQLHNTGGESASNRRIRPAQNRITEGVIWQQLLLFFFPILFGTFFQQLYNTADAVIVGRFVGKEALAAVGGPTGTIINLLVGFFVGISSGATVIISQYYGAKKADMVDYAVHTAAAFSLICGGGITIVGFLAAPSILKLMGTPADIMNYSITYIRIFFLGSISNMIYNIGSSVLRAVGDSKRPLFFLIACCATNIALDLLFVVTFHMGVAGAALATILSQTVSALMVIAVLTRTSEMYRLILSRIRLDGRMLRRIIRIGLPSGLQSTMYGLSNLIIQSSINSLGTDTVAAWTAYSKIDVLFWMVLNAFGISITTFIGQNYGAGKLDRAKKGLGICLGMAAFSCVIISITYYTASPVLLRMFTTDSTVLARGVFITRFLVPAYITYVVIEIYSGALRGVSDTWLPMIVTLLGICFLRVAWILIAVPMRRDITTVIFSYPLTWTVTSCFFLIYLHKFSRLRR